MEPRPDSRLGSADRPDHGRPRLLRLAPAPVGCRINLRPSEASATDLDSEERVPSEETCGITRHRPTPLASPARASLPRIPRFLRAAS